MTLVKYQKPGMIRNHDPKAFGLGFGMFNELFNDNFTEERIHNRQFFAVPPANIVESKVDFRIEIAAPGYEKSDFAIEFEKNLLTISLDKSVDASEDEKFNMKEFDFSNFKRSFRINDKINTEKISAIYKNGVLQLALPKREEAIEKPKREIKIS